MFYLQFPGNEIIFFLLINLHVISVELFLQIIIQMFCVKM